MKIGILDLDRQFNNNLNNTNSYKSTLFPNLAIGKLTAYHKSIGDSVENALGFEHYDILYQVKVFSDTPDDLTVYNADKIICGGSGFDLDNKLPCDIEHCCPDFSLYGDDFNAEKYSQKTAYGFLTRGCPRNCPFCIVGKKEGYKSEQVAELKEWYRGEKEIKLLDPNLLACKNAENLLQQLASVKAQCKVDYTQGLDVRFMTEDFAKLICLTNPKMLHFAWDRAEQDLTQMFVNVHKWLNKYKKFDYAKLTVYVLCNFNTSHEQDLYRIYTLRDLGFNPYVMIYDKPNAPKITRQLGRWVNNRRIFRTVDKFENYERSIH
jgi:organic radical activating enzyme